MSNSLTSSSTSPSTKARAKQRKRVAKFGMAAVGLVGVGAALTSATWTDDVWFAADTSAATVDLQGSDTGLDGDWQDIRTVSESGELAPILIASDEFENLLPGDVRVITVHLRNDGTTDVELGAAPTYDFTGDFETALDAATDVAGVFGTTTLAAGADTTLALTLTVPEPWDEANMGAAGSLLVTVTGTGTND
jgi:hypothetical protein